MRVDLHGFASVLLRQPIHLLEGANAISQPEDGKIFVVEKLIPSPYPVLQCWHNCRQHVGLHGGRIVFGWALFYSKDFYQAQHHAIWHDGKQGYSDVTPDVLSSVRKTIFLADGRVPYDYQNRRHPASFFYHPAEPRPVWAAPGTKTSNNCYFIRSL